MTSEIWVSFDAIDVLYNQIDAILALIANQDDQSCIEEAICVAAGMAQDMLEGMKSEVDGIFEWLKGLPISEHDGCSGCEYDKILDTGSPCKLCKQAYEDKYTREEPQ